ncbi:MAG: TonB-dependent receptor plug domain-containing protein [Bacteroidales bacterium]|nr:TonB-dependent receptor plug domain-containing protein [Bacteroidales bacterium]
MKRFLLFITALSLLGVTAAAQEKVRDPESKTQYNTVFDLLRHEPGVMVGPGGDNGDMPNILIRGIATNSEHTQPLFVVDGIITDNVTYLRPEDIYSVEVLKDGTAAIYGVQGQNGVIMFKTKAAAEAEKMIAEQSRRERQAAKEARKAAREARRAAKKKK